MPVIKYDHLKMQSLEFDNAKSVSKAVPVGKNEGWEDYTMRVFRLGPGGFSPRHSHDWEHVNYIIKGYGTLRLGDEVHELKEKDFAFVPPNIEHQFMNAGDDDFEFICIVPNRGEY